LTTTPPRCNRGGMWNRIKSLLTSKTGIAAISGGAAYLLGAFGLHVPPEAAAAVAGALGAGVGGVVVRQHMQGQLDAMAAAASGPARSIERAIKEGKLPGPKGGIGTSP
jgi:hypothetical protein